MARDIDRAMRFMAACGADSDALRTVDFYSSHEGLILDYERPLTRIDSRTGLPYNVSAHFVWIGERTRQLDGAHVDSHEPRAQPDRHEARPVDDPAGRARPDRAADPDGEPGRLTLVSRMGARNIREKLPRLVEAVARSGRQVLWICDPMHGNTFEAASGYKTRRFDDVIDEVQGFFEVHEALGTVPGGLHIELTGDDVTECLGGAEEIDEADLATRLRDAVRPAAEPPAVARAVVPRGGDARPPLIPIGSGPEDGRSPLLAPETAHAPGSSVVRLVVMINGDCMIDARWAAGDRAADERRRRVTW